MKFDLDKVWTEERDKLLKQQVAPKEFVDGVARRVQPLLDGNKGWARAKSSNPGRRAGSLLGKERASDEGITGPLPGLSRPPLSGAPATA